MEAVVCLVRQFLEYLKAGFGWLELFGYFEIRESGTFQEIKNVVKRIFIYLLVVEIGWN